VTEHRGFLDEPAPATPQTSSAGPLERGWIADPHGNIGPIRHDPAAVLADRTVSLSSGRAFGSSGRLLSFTG
jgi:hypothetical protein